jgi:hypothetical protein
MSCGEGGGVNFIINVHQYFRYYLLTNTIYPKLFCFVQTIHAPMEEKKAHFAKRQEATKKNVECTFGILQAHFAII